MSVPPAARIDPELARLGREGPWWRGVPRAARAPEGVPTYLTDTPFIAAWYAGPGGTVSAHRIRRTGVTVVDYAGMRERYGAEALPDPACLGIDGPWDGASDGLQEARLAAIRRCGADGFLRRETWGWAWGDRSDQAWMSWEAHGRRVFDFLRPAHRTVHMALGMDGLAGLTKVSETTAEEALAALWEAGAPRAVAGRDRP